MRGLLTVLGLRRRAEQRQALALGRIVTVRQAQRARAEGLAEQRSRAWRWGTGQPLRDARLLWCDSQLGRLLRQQEESAKKWEEQQGAYRQERGRRLALQRVVERRQRDQRRRQRVREQAALHELLARRRGTKP